ncbi:hypothetical protein L5515_001906 [Caenorhabditis briggsae]|uniref:Uncharacterized protein n=1 Tax=Caenorhabditis briggsae TaxID=6238 RepID=A0AAE9E504_CAEBR|nr:hypothetical protein L5515_001906 [Caenorhabditis briggsae]
MIFLQSSLFLVFPAFVTSVDLEELLSTSEEPVQVLCRWIFFTYVIGFVFLIIGCHIYASMVRPEKRQYTYLLNLSTGQTLTEYTM